MPTTRPVPICRVCSVEMPWAHPVRQYCPKCGREREREQKRKKNQRQRAASNIRLYVLWSSPISTFHQQYFVPDEMYAALRDGAIPIGAIFEGNHGELKQVTYRNGGLTLEKLPTGTNKE